MSRTTHTSHRKSLGERFKEKMGSKELHPGYHIVLDPSRLQTKVRIYAGMPPTARVTLTLAAADWFDPNQTSEFVQAAQEWAKAYDLKITEQRPHENLIFLTVGRTPA